MGNSVQKHTPTPWKARGKHPDFRDVGSDKELACIVYGLTPAAVEANAAFIVRACNAHDDLLAALQMVCDSGARLSDEIEFAMTTAIAKAIT